MLSKKNGQDPHSRRIGHWLMRPLRPICGQVFQSASHRCWDFCCQKQPAGYAAEC